MRHSKNQRDSAGSFSRRLLFCYIYTIVHEPVVRLKTEHHAICVTQENLPTTNIYTQIDFNHSDLESRNGRNNYVQKQKQWNLLYVLFAFLICSSL